MYARRFFTCCPLVFGEFLRTPSKVKMQRNGFRHARPSHPNQWLGILIVSTLKSIFLPFDASRSQLSREDFFGKGAWAKQRDSFKLSLVVKKFQLRQLSAKRQGSLQGLLNWWRVAPKFRTSRSVCHFGIDRQGPTIIKKILYRRPRPDSVVCPCGQEMQKGQHVCV